MESNDSLHGGNGGEVEQLTYQQQMYKLVIPVFLIIACMGILANLLVIAALKPIRIRNSSVRLIMSLTFTDIWTNSVVAFSLLYNSYLPIVNGTEVNACASLTLEIFRTGGLLTSTIHLLLISVHHCIVIMYPHMDHNRLKSRVVYVCAIAWLAPFLFLLSLATLLPEDGYWNCEHVEFYHNIFFRLSVSAFLLGTFFLIIGCYARLYLILRSNREKFSQSRLLMMTDKKRAQERRILWTMVLICSSFFIGWAPATITFAITCKTCELLVGQKFRTLFALSCLQLSFILGKSLANPLIYSIRIPEIDNQLRRIFRGLPLVKKSSMSETRNGSTPPHGLYNIAAKARKTKADKNPDAATKSDQTGGES